MNTPEHVQPIRQGCPLTLAIKLCSGCLLDQSQSFGGVEFTQPLGVGLGLAVRIINQYSHPVCTGRHTDAYTTINDTQEISRDYQLLTQECLRGNSGIHRNGKLCGQQADETDRQVTDDDVMLGSHKSTAQTNRTNESHKTR